MFAVSIIAGAAQAPLQNIRPDWKTHSRGCYDAATLAALQMRLQLDFPSVADGVQRDCLSRSLGHGMEEALKAETLRADPDALGRLMANHTQVAPLSGFCLRCDLKLSRFAACCTLNKVAERLS